MICGATYPGLWQPTFCTLDPMHDEDMHTPLRIGDRVENAVYGSGTVEGFGYKPGCGEHVCVLWDADPLTVATIYRYRLQRVRGNVGGAVQVGQA